jgi:hypothetical protein
MIYKTLHIKLKIEQHESHYKPEEISYQVVRNGLQLLLYF